MRLLSELRRRNVLRMALLYVVAAWLIMQVAEVVITLANLPEWVGPVILAVLAIGFPIALVFSWFYELTPEGISLDTDEASSQPVSSAAGRRIDFIVIAMLAAAVILFAWDKWWTEGPPEQSIAVLPFVNLSGDPEQAYFSDGISEEVLNLMTKVPGLKVIARTSSFSFRDQDLDVQTIADTLGVRHVVQGSIRQDGDLIRVNAQLIDAVDGTHKWSETYERELRDVFSIQDEIAASVALALRLAVSEELLKSRPVDPEAYKLLLRGRHLVLRGDPAGFEAALDAMRSCVEIVPDYALAWAELSLSYWYVGYYGLWPADEANRLAKESLETAMTLDSENAGYLARMSQLVLTTVGDLALAAGYMNKALAIDPNQVSVINGAALLGLQLGRSGQAIDFQRRLLARDPVSPIVHGNMCRIYYYAGQFDQAVDSCRNALKLNPNHWSSGLLRSALLFAGEFDALEAEYGEYEDFQFERLLMLYARGDAEQFEKGFAEAREMLGESAPIVIAQIYAWAGQTDEAFAWLQRSVPTVPLFPDWHMTPFLKPLHDDPRWPDFLEQIGFAKEELAAIELHIPAR